MGNGADGATGPSGASIGLWQNGAFWETQGIQGATGTNSAGDELTPALADGGCDAGGFFRKQMMLACDIESGIDVDLCDGDGWREETGEHGGVDNVSTTRAVPSRSCDHGLARVSSCLRGREPA